MAFKVNMYGTFNIIEACRKRNIPLIFASTCCCYGVTNQHPSTEDGPTIPVDWYGVSKLAAEELIKGLLDKWIILRFGTTYGEGMRPALATYVFLESAHKGLPAPLKGSGNQTRNWIYIDYLVEGCIKAMEKKCYGEIINLAGRRYHSVNELINICYSIVHGIGTTTYQINRLPPRPEDVEIEDISIEKAKKLLGWTPKTGLYEGLERTYLAMFC